MLGAVSVAGSGALNPRRPDDLEAAVRVGASDGMIECNERDT